jgi:hypothetical protein
MGRSQQNGLILVQKGDKVSEMLPRPSTNLSFSNKELNEFTERIIELATAASSQKNSTDPSKKFNSILGTPTKNSASGASSNSPSLRTPLQSKK